MATAGTPRALSWSESVSRPVEKTLSSPRNRYTLPFGCALTSTTGALLAASDAVRGAQAAEYLLTRLAGKAPDIGRQSGHRVELIVRESA